MLYNWRRSWRHKGNDPCSRPLLDNYQVGNRDAWAMAVLDWQMLMPSQWSCLSGHCLGQGDDCGGDEGVDSWCSQWTY
jgi:hypothetical protein